MSWTNKDTQQANNLLKCLRKISDFDDMVGEEYLAYAASWIWLAEHVKTQTERLNLQDQKKSETLAKAQEKVKSKKSKE